MYERYFVAATEGGQVVGVLTGPEIRHRLATGDLPPAAVCLPSGATGQVASQWRPAWAELGLPGPPDGVEPARGAGPGPAPLGIAVGGGRAVVFRRSAAGGRSLICVGLLILGTGVAFTAAFYWGDVTRREGVSAFTFFPLVIFGGFGLWLAVTGAWVVADRAPKLAADGAGITDHTAPNGGRRIPWAEVRGLDCRVEARTGSLGALVVYRRGADGEVTAEAINTSGLEGGPAGVFTEVNRLWLQAAETPATAQRFVTEPGVS